VRSQTVCINDLVEEDWLTGRCAVERKACCLWSLGGARKRAITRREIAEGLKNANLGGVKLTLKSGVEEVSVAQTHRDLTTHELSARVLASAAAKLGEDAKGLAIAKLAIKAQPQVAFESEGEWDVALPEALSEEITVRVFSPRDPAQSIGWAQATLTLEGDALIARRTIHPGEALRAEDFELKKTNLLVGHGAYVRGNQVPDGLRARQTISAGAILTQTAIERIPSVRLGDVVTLILRSEGVRVSAKGIAQGSASVGDMVTVQLSRYNRTFRGRLVEGRLVEVWL
jgi:flagella basal body P-ring formation protein FlgA